MKLPEEAYQVLPEAYQVLPQDRSTSLHSYHILTLTRLFWQ